MRIPNENFRYLEINKACQRCEEQRVRKIFEECRIITNRHIKVVTKGEEMTLDSEGSTTKSEVKFLPHGHPNGCLYHFLMRIQRDF
jgi:hypothetical protein